MARLARPARQISQATIGYSLRTDDIAANPVEPDAPGQKTN
jgi:hypothetical protein